MIDSKSELIRLTFNPISEAIVCIRSASIPITVWPSGAMNSFGAYCASVATARVPFDLIAAGTSFAIEVLIAGVVTGPAEVVAPLEVLELLELPQPASAATTSTGATTATTSFLIDAPSVVDGDLSVKGRRSIGSASGA